MLPCTLLSALLLPSAVWPISTEAAQQDAEAFWKSLQGCAGLWVCQEGIVGGPCCGPLLWAYRWW